MGKIIPFKRKDRETAAAEKLLKIADEIDNLLLKYLHEENVEVRDLVGVLSHRLGSLMAHVDDKSDLWDICERVLKRQARLES